MAMDVRWAPSPFLALWRNVCFVCFILTTAVTFIVCQQSPVSEIPTGSTFAASSAGSSSNPATSALLAVSSSASVPPSASLTEAAVSGCVCDLAVGLCDVQCCCDPDCSAADRSVFATCSDLAARRTERSCVSSYLVADSNSGYQIARDESSSLFCVYVDNYPARLSYVVPDNVNDAATFRRLVDQFGAPTLDSASGQSLLVWQESYYRSGDPILVVTPPDTQGWLAISAPLGGSLECTDFNPAQFLIPTQNRCRRRVSNAVDMCTGSSALSAATYISNYRVARSPALYTTIAAAATVQVAEPDVAGSGGDTVQSSGNGSTAETLYNSTLLVSVVLGSVQCRTPAGTLSACSDIATVAVPSYNVSAAECANVLEQVLFTVVHNSTNGIETVTADVVLISLPAGRSYVDQQFSIKYVRASETAVFHRSGNPGYLRGSAVLAGRLHPGLREVVQAFNESANETVRTGSPYIEISTNPANWLSTMGHASAEFGERQSRAATCQTSPLQGVPVRFGEDQQSGCLMYYDAVNVTQSCSVLQAMSRAILSAPTELTHVGQFGNSLPSNVSNWVHVLLDDESPAAPSAASGAQCPDVRVGLRLDVLYTKTGLLANPQFKIVGVQYTYRYASVLYQCYNTMCSSDATSPTQSVELVSATNFIDISTPPLPQLREIPLAGGQLPYDFFYPLV